VDENGAPWPELVDNHGKKWTVEEAEDIIKTGNVVFRDPELFGKDVSRVCAYCMKFVWIRIFMSTRVCIR